MATLQTTSVRTHAVQEAFNLQEVVASHARAYPGQRLLLLMVNDRTSAADTGLPSLVGHRTSAALHTAATHAVAGRASNCAEEGMWDSTVLSKDLLVHLRQTSRCSTRDR